eukprot:g1237.t1
MSDPTQVSVDVQELQNVMAKLLESPVFADVVFYVEDEKIYAHRAVLCAWSAPFKAMLTSGMKEGSQRQGMSLAEVELHDISAAMFVLLLKYIYTGVVTLSHANALGLLRLANLYEIHMLKRRCEEFIGNHLDPHNACDILYAAEVHNASKEILQEKALHFIAENFEGIARTEGFLSLDYNIVCMILEQNNLNVISENIVFNAVVEWCSSVLGLKKEDVSSMDAKQEVEQAESWPEVKLQIMEVLKRVRFPMMDSQFLTTNVENSYIVKLLHQEVMKELLFEAYRYHAVDMDIKMLVQHTTRDSRPSPTPSKDFFNSNSGSDAPMVDSAVKSEGTQKLGSAVDQDSEKLRLSKMRMTSRISSGRILFGDTTVATTTSSSSVEDTIQSGLRRMRSGGSGSARRRKKSNDRRYKDAEITAINPYPVTVQQQKTFKRYHSMAQNEITRKDELTWWTPGVACPLNEIEGGVFAEMFITFKCGPVRITAFHLKNRRSTNFKVATAKFDNETGEMGEFLDFIPWTSCGRCGDDIVVKLPANKHVVGSYCSVLKLTIALIPSADGSTPQLDTDEPDGGMTKYGMSWERDRFLPSLYWVEIR